MTVHEPQWTENLLATCYRFPVINSMLSTVKATKIFKIRICEIAFAAFLRHIKVYPRKKAGGGGLKNLLPMGSAAPENLPIESYKHVSIQLFNLSMFKSAGNF